MTVSSIDRASDLVDWWTSVLPGVPPVVKISVTRIRTPAMLAVRTHLSPKYSSGCGIKLESSFRPDDGGGWYDGTVETHFDGFVVHRELRPFGTAPWRRRLKRVVQREAIRLSQSLLSRGRRP